MNALNTVLIAGIITYLLKKHRDEASERAKRSQVFQDTWGTESIADDGTITIKYERDRG